MAFGEDDLLVNPSSPDSLRSDSSRAPSSSTTPKVVSEAHNVEITSTKAERTSDDEELEIDEQVFEDHIEVCQRLERTLGLRCYPGREDLEDWTDLAAAVGSRYSSQLGPDFASAVAKQNISPSALLLCLIYIERLNTANPDFHYENLMSSSELFLVSLMSACKFLYDVGEVGDCYNGSWARQFKIPVKTINKLEVSFLDALQWDLRADEVEFDSMMSRVETDITTFGMNFRDFLTYSDLRILTDSQQHFSSDAVLRSIVDLTKVFAALTASYLVLGMVTLSVAAPLILHMSARSQHDGLSSVRLSQNPVLSAALNRSSIPLGCPDYQPATLLTGFLQIRLGRSHVLPKFHALSHRFTSRKSLIVSAY